MPKKPKRTKKYAAPRPKAFHMPFFARLVCRKCGKDELSYFPEGIDNIHRQDIMCGLCRKPKAMIITFGEPEVPKGL